VSTSSFDPREWRRVESLLDEAIDLPASERSAFLEHVEDRTLRDQLATLLAADAADGGLLDQLPQVYPAGLLVPGQRVGPYFIEREIGRGGMGRVFLARRIDGGFDQQVALKVTRAALDDGELVGRFLQERQILARLEHPNIARLIDGGVTADGRPFFAMEYVEGEPITEYCSARQLDVDARLRLFLSVCAAVRHAHQHLIIHRDLKPSNTRVTADGQVKLLDFGIAKLLDPDEVAPIATRAGWRALTPEYAAPEQVRGERITTATDVYALGALLYELLTGRCPLRFTTYAPSEVERVVCEHQPERPSALVRRLRGDLEMIVLQALQKDPARRYSSVDAFVDDLERHRSGLPVHARPDGTAYRIGKFLGRHRIGAAASVLVLLALVAGLVGTAWQANVASREAAKAREVSAFLASLFEVSDPALTNAAEITARELLDRGAARIDRDLAGQPDVGAEMMALLGRVYRQLGIYDRAQPLLERSLALRQSVYGAQHVAVASTLADLAALSLDQGRADEAERRHREALAMRGALLGTDHPDVGNSLRDLATALRRLGRYDEAERLQRDALAIHQRHYGPTHAEVASDLDGLGGILRERGQFEPAIATLRQSLAMMEHELGPDHLETNTVMNNLAVALFEKGDLGEAEEFYRRVLDFDLRRLGEEHPNTATVRNNLAFILRLRGEFAEAEALYRAVLDFDRRKLPPNHPYTATVLYNLATVLTERGAYDEAERCVQESLTLFSEIYGGEHWRVHSAMGGLAAVLHAKGGGVTALDLYREALAGLERSLSRDHPQLEPVLIGLGRLLTERGELNQAEPLLRRAVESRVARLGEGDPRTAEARRALANLSASITP
jgi:eukaryotic-like serine/threonine-protein kinase